MTSKPPMLEREFPKSGIHQLSSGKSFASPFRVPHLAGAMLFGTADAAASRTLLAPDGLHPICTTGDRALGCLWLSDFLDSTVGPYRELTVTLLVADQPLTVPWINGYTPLAAQLRPDALVCEYVLILDNRDAIAYGRDLHGFDKHPGELSFESSGGRYRFEVRQEGKLAVRGELKEQGALSLPAAVAGVARAHGLGSTLRLLTAPHLRMAVTTPKTLKQVRSDLYFRGSMRLYSWDANDRLECGDSAVGKLIESLKFKPTAIQRVLDGEGLMPLPVG